MYRAWCCPSAERVSPASQAASWAALVTSTPTMPPSHDDSSKRDGKFKQESHTARNSELGSMQDRRFARRSFVAAECVEEVSVLLYPSERKTREEGRAEAFLEREEKGERPKKKERKRSSAGREDEDDEGRARGARGMARRARGQRIESLVDPKSNAAFTREP